MLFVNEDTHTYDKENKHKMWDTVVNFMRNLFHAFLSTSYTRSAADGHLLKIYGALHFSSAQHPIR